MIGSVRCAHGYAQTDTGVLIFRSGVKQIPNPIGVSFEKEKGSRCRARLRMDLKSRGGAGKPMRKAHVGLKKIRALVHDYHVGFVLLRTDRLFVRVSRSSRFFFFYSAAAVSAGAHRS